MSFLDQIHKTISKILSIISCRGLTLQWMMGIRSVIAGGEGYHWHPEQNRTQIHAECHTPELGDRDLCIHLT